MRALGLVVVSTLVLPSFGFAARGSRAQARPATQATATALEQAEHHGLDGRFIGRLAHEVNSQRRQGVQSRSRFFEKITVQRDYRGEHVLYRDHEVTAFLDMSDPAHPRFDPEEPPDEDLEGIPPAHRAHILVVPNVPREHIGRTLLSPVTSADLEVALRVTRSAERLAQQLGIKNARVFLNPSERVMIGYLHVHIIGERDPGKPYPNLAP